MNSPFKIGDRVKMTAEGVYHFMARTGMDVTVSGSVLAVFQDREQIKVKRGDVKVNETWHWKFWELDQ